METEKERCWGTQTIEHLLLEPTWGIYIGSPDTRKWKVARMTHSSDRDRRESHSSHRRNSSPEDREYSGYSQADRRGCSYNVSMESQSRNREKRRKRDTDWKRSQKLPPPGKRSPERAIAQSSMYLLRRQRRTSKIHCSLEVGGGGMGCVFLP